MATQNATAAHEPATRTDATQLVCYDDKAFCVLFDETEGDLKHHMSAMMEAAHELALALPTFLAPSDSDTHDPAGAGHAKAITTAASVLLGLANAMQRTIELEARP